MAHVCLARWHEQVATKLRVEKETKRRGTRFPMLQLFVRTLVLTRQRAWFLTRATECFECPVAVSVLEDLLCRGQIQATRSRRNQVCLFLQLARRLMDVYWYSAWARRYPKALFVS